MKTIVLVLRWVLFGPAGLLSIYLLNKIAPYLITFFVRMIESEHYRGEGGDGRFAFLFLTLYSAIIPKIVGFGVMGIIIPKVQILTIKIVSILFGAFSIWFIVVEVLSDDPFNRIWPTLLDHILAIAACVISFLLAKYTIEKYGNILSNI